MGAKVNGVIAPLRTILRNGDQVEVICSNNQHPSETWDEFVVTGKARAQIRKYIRSKKRITFLDTGKNLLNRYFHDRKLELNDKILTKVLHIFSKEDLEDLYVAVGEGLISKTDVFNACYPDYDKEDKRSKLIKFFKRKEKGKKRNAIYSSNDHDIKGLIPGMPVHFAGCCHPLPGDKIIGIVHTGKGITVHLNRCKNIKRIENKDNFIKLFWNGGVANHQLYVGRVRIVASNSFGAISSVAQEIASQNVNISNLKILHKTDSYYEFIVDLELENVTALQNLKAFLRSSKIIYSVDRV